MFQHTESLGPLHFERRRGLAKSSATSIYEPNLSYALCLPIYIYIYIFVLDRERTLPGGTSIARLCHKLSVRWPYLEKRGRSRKNAYLTGNE